VILWFLQGIFAKRVLLVWCFCGEFVVECVANVVEKLRCFCVIKKGHHFEVYFWSDRLRLRWCFHQRTGVLTASELLPPLMAAACA
jgi:hypothetical protein